jgi:hypothetical protein
LITSRGGGARWGQGVEAFLCLTPQMRRVRVIKEWLYLEVWKRGKTLGTMKRGQDIWNTQWHRKTIKEIRKQSGAPIPVPLWGGKLKPHHKIT